MTEPRSISGRESPAPAHQNKPGGRTEQCLMEGETIMVSRQVMRESLDRDLGILDIY